MEADKKWELFNYSQVEIFSELEKKITDVTINQQWILINFSHQYNTALKGFPKQMNKWKTKTKISTTFLASSDFIQ